METEGSSPSYLSSDSLDQDLLLPGKAPRTRACLHRAPGPECTWCLIFSSLLSPQVSRTHHCSHVTDGPQGGGAGVCGPRGEGPHGPLLPQLHDPWTCAVSRGAPSLYTFWLVMVGKWSVSWSSAVSSVHPSTMWPPKYPPARNRRKRLSSRALAVAGQPAPF